MIDIIHSSLIELFRLLGSTEDNAKKTTYELERALVEEAIVEIQNGLRDAEKSTVTDIDTAQTAVGEETLRKTLETASSRTLVAYYAKNKKDYSENQKEIFLTFLTTNKIQRELERKT